MSAVVPVPPLLSLYPHAARAARMDQRRADAEGGRVLHGNGNGRARKLAVVVAVQNVVVAACLMVTLYVYLHLQGWDPSNVHIHFLPTDVEMGNSTVRFKISDSSHMMGVNDEKNEIYIKCTGPYIWYMEVCYKSRNTGETKGTLQLLVGSNTAVSSIELQATHEVCRGHYSIAYLKAKDVASMRVVSTEGLKIKNVTMGLSYLLGKKCEY